MEDTVNAKLLLALRRLAPHVIRVYDSADEYRDVAVPSRRKRWTQVIETIEARAWVRCELRAKGGAVLGYVEQETIDSESAPPPEGPHMRWYLDMMLRAQTMALQFVNKEHAALLGAVREILEVQTQATRETIELMRMQRDTASEISALRAAASQDGDLDQIMKIVEASPKLLEKIGPMLAAVMMPRRITAAKPAGKQTPPPAANGATK